MFYISVFRHSSMVVYCFSSFSNSKEFCYEGSCLPVYAAKEIGIYIELFRRNICFHLQGSPRIHLENADITLLKNEIWKEKENAEQKRRCVYTKLHDMTSQKKENVHEHRYDNMKSRIVVLISIRQIM